MKKLLLASPLLLLALATVAYAGSLSPLALPAATSYTLTDIYTRLTTNATATAGNHDFAPSGTPAASFKTLTQIYDAIPTITANLVKLGTSYLGVTGTLTPDGGTAAVADLFSGKSAHLTNDWNLDTGILNLACNTATFDGTANKVADGYDGAGDGTNRWCITDSGDAAAGDILASKKAWVDGLEVTGNIATRTLSAANDTVTAGYYAATNLATVDTDLATANIKSGVTIFGIAGDSNVVNTTSGDAVTTDLVSGKKAWVDGAEVTGAMTNVGAQTITPTTSNTAITAGYHNGAGYCAGDANLVTGNIKNGATIFGVGGSTNVVDTTTGDAAATDILATKKAWVDGAEVTGNIATQTLSAANQTVTAGYYAATTLSAVDADLVATNIKSGVTLFGVVGTGANLASMWNGTSGAFTGGSQANGGADDYNNAGAPAAGRYTAVWTACNASAYNAVTNPGGAYCNTGGDTGAYAKDNSTGLIWSKTMNSSTYALDDSAGSLTWFVANNCTESSGSACTKKTSSKTGCEATTGWSLPHQKQLMMAYIDGSYGNLEASGVLRYYWSATTRSDATTLAWNVYLSTGYTNSNGKTNGTYVRCVRSAS